MLRANLLGLTVFACAYAGNVQPIPIGTLAGAPVIATAVVERVRPGQSLPTEPGHPPDSARECTAELKVLRSIPQMKAPRISIGYTCSGPNAVVINGYPAYPTLEAGRTYVLPLFEDKPTWKLIRSQGYGLVVPVTESAPRSEPPASKRDFIIREITNTFLHGEYSELYRLSTYVQLRDPSELNNEIIAALSGSLPSASPRWPDVSTALLATLGIPRKPLDELASQDAAVNRAPYANERLAARALREVPAAERRAGIIRNMLRYSTIHMWGTAATLVPEFENDPLLLDLLPEYLVRGQKGALYTASWLIASGKTTLLDVSLEAALNVLRDSHRDYSEVTAACRLIVEHGSEEQFQEYLGILRHTKSADTNRYRALWQSMWHDTSPRTVRILAVVLADDRRTSQWSDVRNCDFAGALLQRIANEKFGFSELEKMSLADRDAAVARARAWMERSSQPR